MKLDFGWETHNRLYRCKIIMYPENYTIALSNVTIINFIKKKTKSPKKTEKKK